MRRFEVEPLRDDEESPAIAALARAFHDDPLFNFFVADLVRQMHALPSFMRGGLLDAQQFGEVWVARSDRKVAGAAAWLPPGAFPRGPRRDTAIQVRAAPALLCTARRLPAALRLLRAVDEAHRELDVPHYYLAILGVDPAFQRTGAGTALLQPVLARCDERGLVAYLETQKPENVPWYGRAGFDVVQELDVAGCPPLWTLLRKPR